MYIFLGLLSLLFFLFWAGILYHAASRRISNADTPTANYPTTNAPIINSATTNSATANASNSPIAKIALPTEIPPPLNNVLPADPEAERFDIFLSFPFQALRTVFVWVTRHPWCLVLLSLPILLGLILCKANNIVISIFLSYIILIVLTIAYYMLWWSWKAIRAVLRWVLAQQGEEHTPEAVTNPNPVTNTQTSGKNNQPPTQGSAQPSKSKKQAWSPNKKLKPLVHTAEGIIKHHIEPEIQETDTTDDVGQSPEPRDQETSMEISSGYEQRDDLAGAASRKDVGTKEVEVTLAEKDVEKKEDGGKGKNGGNANKEQMGDSEKEEDSPILKDSKRKRKRKSRGWGSMQA